MINFGGSSLEPFWLNFGFFFPCLVEDVSAVDAERVISSAHISSAKLAGSGRFERQIRQGEEPRLDATCGFANSDHRKCEGVQRAAATDPLALTPVCPSFCWFFAGTRCHTPSTSLPPNAVGLSKARQR